MPVSHPDFSKWQVLAHAECSLCSEMLGELYELFGQAAEGIQIVDIGGDAELERRYGQRIPVLLIDGDFVCAYRLDTDRLQGYLQP